jgi:glycolate oxidase iron-sulfur subunit
MQTTLADFVRDTPEGDEAAAILGKCVHCGFCTATCPTYQLLGDELDGPRGRIYLIKQVLEGQPPTRSTQLHLDRCLTCRSCETTCPSGVKFGHLVDIGRKLVDEQVPRSLASRWVRAMLVAGLTGPLFAPALRLGQWLRPLLSAALRRKIPLRVTAGAWPRQQHARKVLMLTGCVQPAMMPNINAATARVLNAVGIEVIVARGAGCCGALRHHMNQQEAALNEARRNVDAWWPHVDNGVEAIVMNASGCGAHVADYGHLLRLDTRYAEQAARVSQLSCDIAQLLEPHAAQLAAQLAAKSAARLAVRIGAGAKLTQRANSERVVFHPPCTLQHGLGIRGRVETILAACGAEPAGHRDSHLCCGSAGSYSILQSTISAQLRERKLEVLMESQPTRILSANIGCIAHLAGTANVPVQHWIEWLDEQLTIS